MTDGDIALTFDAYIRHWADKRPALMAMREGNTAHNYAELEALTAQIVAALLSAGVSKDDRIVWIGKNAELYYTLFYGAARLGVVMVPVGWKLAPPEMQYIVNDVEPKILFADLGFEDAATALASACPSQPTVMGTLQAREWIASAERSTFVPAGPDDAVLQLYTSGTTGNPKGAVLSNRNLFGLRLPAIDAALPWANYDMDELILICMPCAHIGGTGVGVMALGAGVGAIVQPEFNPDHVMDAVEQGASRFFMVPAALQMVIQHPRAAKADFSRLKYIMYGAAPIPLALLREAMEMIPSARFMQVYGMTETAGTVVSLPADDHDPAGNERMRSAGKALPGVTLRIVDDNGADCPAGETGELLIRSASNMLHYWKLDAATQATMDADGWIRTGDAGYLDADGYLFIQDRVKDMIISGGENVYPAEVESAIYGHPAVAEVAVIGVPDPVWGEAVKACVVAKPDQEVDPASIIAWARERIAAYKVPKSVDVIEALPRNATGKIMRRLLRAPYWQGFDRNVN